MVKAAPLPIDKEQGASKEQPLLPAGSGEVQRASVVAMAEGQIETAPNANQSIVDRAAAGPQAVGNDGSLRDSFGALFNPQEHEALPDGSPRKTKSGAFAKKRGMGARKPGSIGSGTTGGSRAIVAEKTQVEAPKAEPSASMIASAAAATQFTEMVGMMVGGDEFRMGKSDLMQGAEEKDFLNSSWLAYFQAKGIEDLPPGLALSFAMFIYVAPRFTLPQTKKRTQGFILWARDKWRGWRSKRDGSHADKRDNRIREDNIRETAAQPLQKERTEDNRS